MKFSTCVSAAFLVASTTAAGCSSCAKDDAAPASSNGVPSDTPSTALTDRKAAPMPRHFERKNPPGIENLAPTVTAPAAASDGGADGATH